MILAARDDGRGEGGAGRKRARKHRKVTKGDNVVGDKTDEKLNICHVSVRSENIILEIQILTARN